MLLLQNAYGNIISKSGTMASVNPYRYAGYRYDEVTGLYYLMARYYDAEVGRFISRDSFHGFAGEPLSINQYNYAHSNPIKYIDPSGYYAVDYTKNLYLGVGTRVWLNLSGTRTKWWQSGSVRAILYLYITYGGVAAF